MISPSPVQKRSIQGYSLLEAAIVMTIMGLLVGGVIAGKSLIHSAEIRAQITDLTRYEVAINTFQNKYGALPGDLANATAYWGTQTTNGNGNGQVESATLYSSGGLNSYVTPDNYYYDGERPQLFKQLGLAKLVKESFDGSANLGTGYPTVSMNHAAGMFVSGKWDTYDLGNDAYAATSTIATATLYMSIDVSNPLQFGLGNTFNDNSGIFMPEDISSIDTKMDDGKPNSGKVLALSLNVYPLCTSSDTVYNIIAAGESKSCNMLYELQK